MAERPHGHLQSDIAATEWHCVTVRVAEMLLTGETSRSRRRRDAVRPSPVLSTVWSTLRPGGSQFSMVAAFRDLADSQ